MFLSFRKEIKMIRSLARLKEIAEGIHINPDHKGNLHKALNIPEGQEIPLEHLKQAKNSDDPEIRKMANFALNARGWKH